MNWSTKRDAGSKLIKRKEECVETQVLHICAAVGEKRHLPVLMMVCDSSSKNEKKKCPVEEQSVSFCTIFQSSRCSFRQLFEKLLLANKVDNVDGGEKTERRGKNKSACIKVDN